MNAKAISEKKDGGGCVLVVAGLVFFAAGSFFFWMVFLSPLLQSLGSGQWPQADCEITKSKVEINSDSDGTSYKPIVEYRYSVDGAEYFGDSPTFQDISASKRWARGIVDRYDVSQPAKCFYDPDDPATSVLDPTFGWSFYAMALFPLIFVAVGLALAGSGWFGWGNGAPEKPKTVSGHKRTRKSYFTSSPKTKLNADGIHEADVLDQEWSEPMRLERTQSRWGGLVVAVVFGVFWNSFVAFFVYMSLKDGGDWFSLLFMIPFVLLGLLIIAGIVYAAMALMNPVIEVALSSGAISPGDSVDVAWEIKGKASKFKSLKINVRGKQQATYRRGTNTYNEEEIFEMIPVLETSHTDEMEFGSALITIPASTMHTLEAGNNKVQWEVVIQGAIPWWPDVNESFEFRVKPV